MSLTFRQHPDAVAQRPAGPILGQVLSREAPAGAADDAAPAGAAAGAITVHHGIHAAQHFLAGMTVGQARRVLGARMNIDPESVPVLNGEPIADEEERVITADDRLLSFVKRSSVRGAAGGLAVR